jgi:glucan phosphoethanolaminetransferase (alkaline phosphatase superfamily)
MSSDFPPSKAVRHSVIAAALLFLLALLPVTWRLSQATVDGLATAALPAYLTLAVWAVFAALAGRARRWLWLLLLAAVLSPWETFYIAHFRLVSGPHLYGVIADTHWNEVSSWLGPWMLTVLIATTLQLGVVCWLGQQVWRADWRWTHRSRWWVLGAMALLLFFIGMGEALTADADTVISRDQPHSYLQHSLNGPAETPLVQQLEASFPWGLPLRWARFAEHQRALDTHMRNVQSFDFKSHLRSSSAATRRIVHVLVIGETARADRWSLFGAERSTTPQLDARSLRGELAAFSDAASPAAATRESVPLMLTRRPPGAALQHTPEPSMVTAFKQAGFRTYWLSTQGAAGRHETPVSVLAREAHEQHFINGAEYLAHGAQDGELLLPLAGILARSDPRQFIVLHTLGSHLHYAHRYPAEFARFQPALAPTDKADIWRRDLIDELRNAYDNSVVYTDHVVDEVIRLIERSDAVATLTFAADHGESLFDGNCPRGGHGFAAVANFHVPFFVWASPNWREQRPADWGRLLSRQHRPVSTLSVFSTVLDLAGLDIADESSYPGVGSAQWTPGPRPVTHFGDYGKDILTKACDRKPATASQP